MQKTIGVLFANNILIDFNKTKRQKGYKMNYKLEVKRMCEENDLQILADDIEKYSDETGKLRSRHVLEVYGKFDDATSRIYFGWNDAYQSLSEIFYSKKVKQ